MAKSTYFILALSIALFACMGTASASFADLTITHKGTDKIAPGSSTNFTVTLTNNGNEALVLDIVKDPFWALATSWFELISITPNRIELAGKGSKDITVTIKIKRTVPADESYSTFIRVMPLGKPELSVDHPFIIRVAAPESLLKTEVTGPEKTLPGRDYEVRISLENNLNILLSEVEVYVTSELFEETRGLKVLPLQKRDETFKFTVPSSAVPASYNLNVRVYYDKQLVKKITKAFVVSTISDVSFKTDSGKGFLMWWAKATKSNMGNTVIEETINFPLTKFQRMFASYSIEPNYIDSDGAHWSFSINPGGEYSAAVYVNYRSLFLVILVIVSFAIFTYFMLTRGVQLKKEVLMLKTTNTGDTELKVKIHIKNHSRQPLKQAELIEILPHHMHPKTHFETLQPEKIQKGERGIRLLWVIPEIASHEERIVTYTFETKIGVLGKMVMPPAMLRYKTKSDKITAVRSNELEFHSGTEEKKKR